MEETNPLWQPAWIILGLLTFKQKSAARDRQIESNKLCIRNLIENTSVEAGSRMRIGRLYTLVSYVMLKYNTGKDKTYAATTIFFNGTVLS